MAEFLFYSWHRVPPKNKDDQAGVSRKEGPSAGSEAVEVLQEESREGI